MSSKLMKRWLSGTLIMLLKERRPNRSLWLSGIVCVLSVGLVHASSRSVIASTDGSAFNIVPGALGTGPQSTQSANPDAGLQARLVLAHSEEEFRQWNAAAPEVRAKSGSTIDVHPGEQVIVFALVLGSGVGTHALAVECSIVAPDGQAIRQMEKCLGETHANPQFPDAALLVLFATNYPDKAIPGVHKIQAHIRDDVTKQVATIEGQIRLVPAASTLSQPKPAPAAPQPVAKVAPQPATAEDADFEVHLLAVESPDWIKVWAEKEPMKRPSEWKTAAEAGTPLYCGVVLTNYRTRPGQIYLTADFKLMGPNGESASVRQEYKDAKTAQANSRFPGIVILWPPIDCTPAEPKNTRYPYGSVQVTVTDIATGASAQRSQHFYVLPGGSVPRAPARVQGFIGAKYGTRDPVSCSSTAEPANGPISPQQAMLYFMCAREGEHQGLVLIENLRLEVGQGHVPSPGELDVNMDRNGLIYPIRGSFTLYTCYAVDSSRGFLNNVGRNCDATDQPEATGECHRTSFGDWDCDMHDARHELSFHHSVAPPPVR